MTNAALGELTPQQAWQLLQDDPRTLLVDIRSTMEYLFVGHPKGAVHVPWIDEPEWTENPHFVTDIRKLLLAGADVVHLCSALLAKGPAYLSHIERGITDWMEEQGFESVADFRGRVSALSVPNPAEFERSNYVHILDSYSFSPGVMV